MKKKLIILMFLACVIPCFGAFTTSISERRTYKNAYRWTGKPKDLLLDWAQEVENALDGTVGLDFLYLIPGDGPSAAKKGDVRFTVGNNLQYYTTSWQTVAASTSSTLDEAYSAGQSITVDVAAMTLTQADTAWSTLAIVSTAGTTNDYDCVTITTSSSGYTGDSLYIDGISGSTDIRGDNWDMSQDGVLTLKNGLQISNIVNDKILFDSGAEDLVFDLTTGTNTVTLGANGTGAVTWDFGDFVTVQGVSTLIGSTAGDFTIQVTSDSGGEDLIINQAGSGAYSVIINSSGTGTDAIDLTTSTGGINMVCKDDFLLAVTSNSGDDDLVLQQIGGNDSGIILNVAGTSADAILLTASAGGITLTATGAASGDVVITTVDDFSLVATDDITIDGNSAGSVITIGGNNDGNVIAIGTDDTVADAITIGSIKDTIIVIGVATTIGSTDSAAATTIQSGTGDLALTSTDDITLTINTAVTDNITLTNTLGTAADAISIVATAGGVNIDAATTLDVDISGGQVLITSKDDAASAIALTTNVGTSETIVITNTLGTGTGAIQITTTAATGDIDINSGDAITIDCGDIVITTDDALAAQFKVVAGGVNAGDVIELESTDGRILLDANGGINGDIELNSEDDIVLTTAGKLTITNNSEAMTVSGDLTMAGTITVVGVVQADQVVTDQANYQVLAANSGKIHYIVNMTQNTTIKLPPEADGLNYEFWYVGGAADSDDHNITSEDVTNFFIGGVVWLDSANAISSVYSNGTANYILTIPNMAGGTIIKITCDGTNWYVTGIVVSDTTPTMTGA